MTEGMSEEEFGGFSPKLLNCLKIVAFRRSGLDTYSNKQHA